MEFVPARLNDIKTAVKAPELTSEPIDLRHLRRYTFGDQDLEREVLSLFLTQLPQTITALKSASSEHDWRIAAHTLKGSSRAVGAWRLASLAEHAEAVSGGVNRAAWGEAVSRIEAVASDVRAFIDGVYACR